MKHLSEDEAQQQFVKVVAAILRRLLQNESDWHCQGNPSHVDASA